MNLPIESNGPYTQPTPECGRDDLLILQMFYPDLLTKNKCRKQRLNKNIRGTNLASIQDFAVFNLNRKNVKMIVFAGAKNTMASINFKQRTVG